MMKRKAQRGLLQKLKIIGKGLGALLIFSLIVEVASATVLFFVRKTDSYQQWQRTSVDRTHQLNWFDNNYRYHPYLGYSRDMEPEKSALSGPQVLRLAILGGSFAENLGGFLRTERGQNLLLKKLSESGKSFYKDVTVINLAGGAIKQPQSLIASVLYMDEADIFISFEGFNEVLTVTNSCFPVSWPVMFDKYDPSAMTLYKRLGIFEHKSFNFLKATSDAGFSFFTLLFYLSGERIYQSTLKLRKRHDDELFSMPVCRDRAHLAKEAPAIRNNAIKRAWFEPLIRQHQIFKGVHKPLLTFLQPNQYLPETKIWSDEEKKIFAGNRVEEDVRSIYSDAVIDFVALAKANQNLIDMTGVFKNNAETIYRDDCCHLNDHGEELLVEAIWPFIAKVL